MSSRTARDTSHDNEIWNPWAALALSVIFTPVFGALLHGTDLRHIGDKEGAVTAFVWERISMVLLAAAAVIQPLAAVRPGWQYFLLVIHFSLFILWAVFCGFRQARFISEAQRLSSRLTPVPVSRAVTLGCLGMLAWAALFQIAKSLWTLMNFIPD